MEGHVNVMYWSEWKVVFMSCTGLDSHYAQIGHRCPASSAVSSSERGSGLMHTASVVTVFVEQLCFLSLMMRI